MGFIMYINMIVYYYKVMIIVYELIININLRLVNVL